jgi:hypothetical protein
MLSDVEEFAAQLTAIKTFAIYSQAALILALREADPSAIDRVFVYARMNANILRQTAERAKGDAIAARGCAGAADMLLELEGVIRNMVTKPPGSGTA